MVTKIYFCKTDIEEYDDLDEYSIIPNAVIIVIDNWCKTSKYYTDYFEIMMAPNYTPTKW